MESLGEDGNLHDIFSTHKYSANAKSILREAAERVSVNNLSFAFLLGFLEFFLEFTTA
jgi:hypothetical protein